MDVSDAESEYKAATLTLQRRYANNYSLYGAVTWSEDRDNDSNERNFAGIQVEDYNDLDINWGPSNRDQEWKVVLNGVWDTPLWGIGLSGAFRYATGSPYTADHQRRHQQRRRTRAPTGRPSTACTSAATASASRTSTRFDLRLSKGFGIGPGDLAAVRRVLQLHRTRRTRASASTTRSSGPPRPTTRARTTFGAEDQFVRHPAHVPARSAVRLLRRRPLSSAMTKGGRQRPPSLSFRLIKERPS